MSFFPKRKEQIIFSSSAIPRNVVLAVRVIQLQAVAIGVFYFFISIMFLAGSNSRGNGLDFTAFFFIVFPLISITFFTSIISEIKRGQFWAFLSWVIYSILLFLADILFFVTYMWIILNNSKFLTALDRALEDAGFLMLFLSFLLPLISSYLLIKSRKYFKHKSWRTSLLIPVTFCIAPILTLEGFFVIAMTWALTLGQMVSKNLF